MWTQVIFLFQDLLDQCTVNSAAVSGQRFPGRCISEWLFLWHGGASINWVVLSLGIHPNPKMGFRFGKYDGFAQMWWSVPFSAKDCKPATWLFRVAKKFLSWGGTLLYLLMRHEVIQKRDIPCNSWKIQILCMGLIQNGLYPANGRLNVEMMVKDQSWLDNQTMSYCGTSPGWSKCTFSMVPDPSGIYIL